MGGMFSEGLVGRLGRASIGSKALFGKGGPLGMFAKPDEGKKASTGPAINQGTPGTAPAKRKAVRQRIAPTNTPLSSDPNNPLGGR